MRRLCALVWIPVLVLVLAVWLAVDAYAALVVRE